MQIKPTDSFYRLLSDVYPNIEDRINIEIAVEQHLIRLNRDKGRVEATEFLIRQENALREEFSRKQKLKGRERLWIIAKSSLPALVLVVTKIFGDNWPLG